MLASVFYFVVSASDMHSMDLFSSSSWVLLIRFLLPWKKKAVHYQWAVFFKGQKEKLSTGPQHLVWLQTIFIFSTKLSSGAWFPLTRNLSTTEPAPDHLQLLWNLMGRQQAWTWTHSASGAVSSSALHFRMRQRDWRGQAQPQRRAALCSFGDCSYNPFASFLLLVGPLRLARLCLPSLSSGFLQANWPNQAQVASTPSLLSFFSPKALCKLILHTLRPMVDVYGTCWGDASIFSLKHLSLQHIPCILCQQFCHWQAFTASNTS